MGEKGGDVDEKEVKKKCCTSFPYIFANWSNRILCCETSYC